MRENFRENGLNLLNHLPFQSHFSEELAFLGELGTEEFLETSELREIQLGF